MAALPETLAAGRVAMPGESHLRAFARNAFPFLVLGGVWEIVAHLGLFPAKLFPPIETIAAAFYRLTVSGILPLHVAETLLRLAAGFALAAVIGVTLGILMGRSRRIEDIALPLVSIGAPIPGIAYAPLFMLWFDLGNKSADPAGRIRLGLPDHLQHLDRRESREGDLGALGAGHGRRRSAPVPACDPAGRAALCAHGSAARPRAGLAHPGGRRAAGRGAERARAPDLWRAQFLATDVMLAGIAVIGIIGLALEKLVFQRLEQATVIRWGMMTS